MKKSASKPLLSGQKLTEAQRKNDAAYRRDYPKFKGKEEPAEHDTHLYQVGQVPKGKTKHFSGYRYLIKTRLVMLDPDERKIVKEKVLKLCGITERTYITYINIEKSDTNDIPSVVLFYFSRILKCSINDLFNGAPHEE